MMMQSKKRGWGVGCCALLSAMLLTSCLKEGTETIVVPKIEQNIPENVLPPEMQDELIDNGFVINSGQNPPDVTGRYLVSPLKLKYASDGYSDTLFHDLYITFSNQTGRGLIEYAEVQSDSVAGKSIEARIIGKDDQFTMYCNQYVEAPSGSWRCKTATIVSGKKTAEGIVDLSYAFVITEQESSQPGEAPSVAPVGTVRVFADGDGVANKITE